EITSSSSSIISKSNRASSEPSKTDEMLSVYDLATGLSGKASISEAGDIIVSYLRQLIPFSNAVLFAYEVSTDEFVAKYTTGAAVRAVAGLRFPLGELLRGWVGPHQKTIVNSDPVLDLGEKPPTAVPRLRSCLSTPMVTQDTLIGVLTLYSPDHDAFDENHKR